MTKSSINDIFDKTSFLHGANAVYIEQMFERFQNDPADIPDDWRTFFSGITDNLNQQNILRASWASQNVETNNEEDILEVNDLLSIMGTVQYAGPLGSGHAIKALNNYVSAAGLIASFEALKTARSFGIKPENFLKIIKNIHIFVF